MNESKAKREEKIKFLHENFVLFSILIALRRVEDQFMASIESKFNSFGIAQ